MKKLKHKPVKPEQQRKYFVEVTTVGEDYKDINSKNELSYYIWLFMLKHHELQLAGTSDYHTNI